jgi:hypothetical protein
VKYVMLIAGCAIGFIGLYGEIRGLPVLGIALLIVSYLLPDSK